MSIAYVHRKLLQRKRVLVALASQPKIMFSLIKWALKATRNSRSNQKKAIYMLLTKTDDNAVINIFPTALYHMQYPHCKYNTFSRPPRDVTSTKSWCKSRAFPPTTGTLSIQNIRRPNTLNSAFRPKNNKVMKST